MKKMIKLFKKHLVERNITYFGHAQIALLISTRLFVSSVLFFLHSIFPFINIPRHFNLESMAIYLFDKNVEIDD